MYEAKTHLSRLCEETAATGEPCIISRNGRPLVKLVPVREPGGAESVWDTVEEGRARYGPLREAFAAPERLPREDAASSPLDADEPEA